MYSGQTLQTTGEDARLLAERSGTNRDGQKRSISGPALSSPESVTVAGPPDNGSTVPCQLAGDHASSSTFWTKRDVKTVAMNTALKGRLHGTASLDASAMSTDENRNSHPWNERTGKMMNHGNVQSAIDYPTRRGAEQANSSFNELPMSQPEDTGSRPQPGSRPDEGDEDFSTFLPLGVLDQTTVAEKYSIEISILKLHLWIRTQVKNGNLRIYLDPKLTHRNNTQKSIKKLRAALKIIMSSVDASKDSWEGLSKAKVNDPDLNEDESMWYIFNTLQDPNPQPDLIMDKWSQQAMLDLLSDDDFSESGLKTRLHPYQRRSAATMIQREVQPAQVLDPRLQAHLTPTGIEYYYDREDACILLERSLYSEACGGILAETMGCGKTFISLAVIWATRGHVPKIPIKYLLTAENDRTPIREKTGSLMEMAAATAGRHSAPWKAFFEEKRLQGTYYERCIKACKRNCGFYEIPPHQTRYQGRHSVSYPRPPSKRVRLCTGTLIIVPNNLVDHWQHEIDRHTAGLKVLVLQRGDKDKTPSADDLLEYDIVLFAKTRFEREVDEPVHNRRQRFVQMNSPLTELHWLRVIVDEGHNVAGHGSKTNMIHLLGQMHIERRWVISGTPSTGLYGVEISLASQEAGTSDTESPGEIAAVALQGRKKTGNAIDNELKDLDRLRRMVTGFLEVQPWSNSRDDDPADWTKYMKPIGPDGKRRKSPAIRATLQGLVVRHQHDTLNKEISLPDLYNRVVYLEPTFHDRLSINLFLFGLAVNAITSERQGPDYMFDPKNRKHLNQTINNLRQAGFWWAGSEVNPQDSIDHAEKYMESKGEIMTPGDLDQFAQGIDIAEMAIKSGSWHKFKQLHELGVFLENFPEDSRSHWALDQGSDSESEPLLIGITQARRAQQFVTQNLRSQDPTQGLSGAGIKVRGELERRDQRAPAKGAPESANNNTSGSATSSPGQLNHSPKPQSHKSPKKTFKQNLCCKLPQDSPLMKTKFVATSSAKLTYLLDQVLHWHKEEKIIIFYDNTNSAFWIAEGLELLGIEFRIYASTLKPELRTQYLELFRESNDIRVLLMDLRQASHGLHIAQASRVYITNPIWQPTIESQAIKRSHRIGQTRPVHVETLVLQDTLEDRMLRRRKEMSETEMQHAERSLLDDTAMNDIIQREPFLPMLDENGHHFAEARYLQQPTTFFDRHPLPIPDEVEIGPAVQNKTKRPHLADSDADDTDHPRMTSPTPKRPRIGFATSVQFIEPQSESESTRTEVSSPHVSSKSPSSPFEGVSDAPLPRRKSLFGP